MSNCNKVSTPATGETNKPPGESDILDNKDSTEYRSAVGGLLFLMMMTRPELAFSTGRLSRKMALPSEHDRDMLKRVLRFVKGTTNTKFILRKPSKNAQLTACSDSDFAGYKPLARSTSGFAVFYDGNLISFKSRMHFLFFFLGSP